LEASAGDGFSVGKVEATKRLEADGADISVNPRYNVETEEADVVVNYSKDGTDVELPISQDAQSVTISRQLDDENRVAPTIGSNGDMSVAWERSLGDDNSITTTLSPDEAVDIVRKDSAWTASINLPLDGTEVTGTNVSIKREVNF
jgi:predicted PilT family ATPase